MNLNENRGSQNNLMDYQHFESEENGAEGITVGLGSIDKDKCNMNILRRWTEKDG